MPSCCGAEHKSAYCPSCGARLAALGACLAFLVTRSFPAACAAAVLLWLAAGVLAWAECE